MANSCQRIYETSMDVVERRVYILLKEERVQMGLTCVSCVHRKKVEEKEQINGIYFFLSSIFVLLSARCKQFLILNVYMSVYMECDRRSSSELR